MAQATAQHRLQRFPESFSRTSPGQDDYDRNSDASMESTPPSEFDVHEHNTRYRRTSVERSRSPAYRQPRSNAMRLESILNDVSSSHSPYIPHSASISPVQQESQLRSPSPSPVPSPISRTTQCVPEKIVKKKKVKMHRCPECQKDFPRPSGLRTHMNMHTKEKPFACSFPGCSRAFSVVSNAKRHMRTHGLGVSSEEQLSDPSTAAPYVVDFEAPVVGDRSHPESDPKEPLKLRWVAPTPSPSSAGTTATSSPVDTWGLDGLRAPHKGVNSALLRPSINRNGRSYTVDKAGKSRSPSYDDDEGDYDDEESLGHSR